LLRIGVDLGGTKIEVAALDAARRMLERHRIATPAGDYGAILAAIVVREILTHLGRWQPEAQERAPPVPPEAWPAHASLTLTYHPIPDIA